MLSHLCLYTLFNLFFTLFNLDIYNVHTHTPFNGNGIFKLDLASSWQLGKLRYSALWQYSCVWPSENYTMYCRILGKIPVLETLSSFLIFVKLPFLFFGSPRPSSITMVSSCKISFPNKPSQPTDSRGTLNHAFPCICKKEIKYFTASCLFQSWQRTLCTDFFFPVSKLTSGFLAGEIRSQDLKEVTDWCQAAEPWQRLHPVAIALWPGRPVFLLSAWVVDPESHPKAL